MRLWFSFILFVLIFGSANAQNYNFDYLSIQQGLPQSQVFAICFDDNQYAWMGTQGGGLCRYNGKSYSYYTTQDSLLSNRVYDIKIFDSQIWVACKGGVSVFESNGKYVKNIRLDNQNEIVTNLTFFEEQVWVGTDKSVYNIQNNSLNQITINPNLINVYVKSFFQEDEQNLWVNTKSGAFNLKNPFVKLNKNKGLPSDYVTTMTTYKNDWLIGTYGSGIKLYSKDKGIKDVPELESLDNDIVLDVLVNGSEVWIGTMNNGIYIWNETEKTIKNFSSNNGLSNNHVRKLIKDYWGNIWIGTSGGGISIYNNSPFLEYNKLNGLNSNYIYAVANDINNNLWVATEGKGVVRLNDTSKVLFDEEYGYVSAKTKVIFEDGQHNIWFGSEGEGVGLWFKNDGKDTIYRYEYNQGLKNGWVKTFAQSPETGQIVVGTNEGVYVLMKNNRQPEKFRFKKVNNSEIPSKITSLCFDENGVLYFSSSEGVGKINGGEVTKLSENYRFRNVVVLDNILYGGTADKGVLKINIENLESEWINSNNWLNSDNVYQLVVNENKLWVGTEKGLVKLILNTNKAILSKQFYQYEDGFEGVETNLNAACLDNQKKLWFGTTNGLFLFNGDVVNTDQKKPPKFHLNDIQILYQSILETKYSNFFLSNNDSILKLPHDQNHIGFNVEGIDYAYPNKIKFKWKLEGADQKWTPPSNSANATYSNLIPGEYTFLAKASIDDNWDIEPVSFQFVISPPIWEESWFKVGYYLLGVLLIGLIVLIFYRRFKRNNKIEKDKLEMEKSLLELEQKALRLQMNPHFIFNVLNSIHNQIILNDSAKARYSLAKFSKLMRRVLENSREKCISIDDEIETIENYVQLEKLTNDIEFDFNVIIDENIDTNEPILPPLMIQPFIENAIIHGIKGLDRVGEITISFNLPDDNILQCVIEDNGVGRLKSSKSNAQKENYHKSTALEVTQERLANLQTKISKNINFKPFQIIDKYNDKKEPFGTKIIIQIEI
jgi:ligand-binding sensor domain-containing protein